MTGCKSISSKLVAGLGGGKMIQRCNQERRARDAEGGHQVIVSLAFAADAAQQYQSNDVSFVSLAQERRHQLSSRHAWLICFFLLTRRVGSELPFHSVNSGRRRFGDEISLGGAVGWPSRVRTRRKQR